MVLAKGVDPTRADALRVLYLERRQSRRENIRSAAAGHITRQELAMASARDQARLDRRVAALLTPEEILYLEANQARTYAVEFLERLDARKE